MSYGPELSKLTNDKKNCTINRAMYHPARASSDVASSLALSPGRRKCRPLAAVYSGLVRPLLRPARSPSEGPAAPADAAAVPMLQQLPAARH